MLPELPHSELNHNCTHHGCCSHKAVDSAAAFDPAAGTSPELHLTKMAVLWDSFKRYVLWFLAFFGIYASSSVCVF